MKRLLLVPVFMAALANADAEIKIPTLDEYIEQQMRSEELIGRDPEEITLAERSQTIDEFENQLKSLQRKASITIGMRNFFVASALLYKYAITACAVQYNFAHAEEQKELARIGIAAIITLPFGQFIHYVAGYEDFHYLRDELAKLHADVQAFGKRTQRILLTNLQSNIPFTELFPFSKTYTSEFPSDLIKKIEEQIARCDNYIEKYNNYDQRNILSKLFLP